jgi:L-rhamnose isomerase/sugar isomerase
MKSGHHFTGQNIEHIVAFLIDEERLGGFHFNNHKYADDDLTAGSINPYELFLIYNELAKAEDAPNNNPPVAYMVDQAHVRKSKIDAMIQTIEHIQMAYAKALCINRAKLLKAQKDYDIVTAEVCMTEAFNTDVLPLLKVVREEMGVDPNPLDAFRASGYWARMAKERGDRAGTGGVGA